MRPDSASSRLAEGEMNFYVRGKRCGACSSIHSKSDHKVAESLGARQCDPILARIRVIFVRSRTEDNWELLRGHPTQLPPLRVRKKCRGGNSRSNLMANDSGTRSTSGNKETQSGSESQQVNRGTQSQSGSNMSGSQSSTEQQSGSGATKGNRPEDKTRNQAGGPGTGSSQYTNAGSTGTGSGQISPHNPASGQSSSSGRSSSGSGSSGGDRNT